MRTTTKLNKVNKEIKDLEKVMDCEESNMQMLVKNFTDYKFEIVSYCDSWYEIVKDNNDIVIDEETIKPEDVENWIWDKLIDYVGALKLQYKRYIKLLDEQEKLEAM